jgi:hypothetical protein
MSASPLADIVALRRATLRALGKGLEGFRIQPVGVTLAGSGRFDHALRDDLPDKIGRPNSRREKQGDRRPPHDRGGALVKTGFFKQDDDVYVDSFPPRLTADASAGWSVV